MAMTYLCNSLPCHGGLVSTGPLDTTCDAMVQTEFDTMLLYPAASYNKNGHGDADCVDER